MSWKILNFFYSFPLANKLTVQHWPQNINIGRKKHNTFYSNYYYFIIAFLKKCLLKKI